MEQIEFGWPEEETRIDQGGVRRPEEAGGFAGSHSGGDATGEGGTMPGEGENVGGAEGGVEGEVVAGGAGPAEPE